MNQSLTVIKPSPIFDILKTLADGRIHPIDEFMTSVDQRQQNIAAFIKTLSQQYGAVIREIEPHHYQLDEPITWLNEEAVYTLLSPKAHSTFTLSFVKTLNSTNTQLKTLAEKNRHHGLVLAAEWQSHGYGKNNRKWNMPIGKGLVFSLLWGFDQPLSALCGVTLATGIAVVQALNRFKVEAKLKWPNDVLLNQKKLGGILVENLCSNSYPSLFVIGIGLNTQTPTDDTLEAIGCNIADRNLLFAHLLNSLFEILTRFSQEGFGAFKEEWEAHCAHLNQTVDLFIPKSAMIRGVFTGITQEGALILQTKEAIKIYPMGEISLRIT